MAPNDEVLQDVVEPEAVDFVDRPEKWYIDDDEVYIICGVEFPASEFTERERAEWLRIRDEHDLLATETKYRDLLGSVTKSDRSNLIKQKRERLQILQDEIQKVTRETPVLEWTEDTEVYIGKLAAEADKIESQIEELEKPYDEELYNRMDEMQQTLSALKESRDPAFLEMAWKMAVLNYGEKRSLEQWKQEARGSDRLSAQELIYKGNFTWEAPRLNRAQRRALTKQKRAKNQRDGNIESTSLKQ